MKREEGEEGGGGGGGGEDLIKGGEDLTVGKNSQLALTSQKMD